MACLQVDGTVVALPASSCNGWIVMEPAEYTALIAPLLQTREQSHADGLALGWAVGGVIIAVGVFKLLIRAVRNV